MFSRFLDIVATDGLLCFFLISLSKKSFIAQFNIYTVYNSYCPHQSVDDRINKKVKQND